MLKIKSLTIPNKLFSLALLFLVTFLVYYPCLFHDFVNWDDAEHLLNNEQVRSLAPGNILKIFQSTVNQTYIPLTITSFSLEYHFFGFNPFVFHLTNVFLHLAVMTLVFILATELGFSVFPATIAALLFGIHPMHVESVAWVTQRKDVLYALFYLLALLDYLHYLNRKRSSYYYRSLFWGALSMLAKPMAVSLPLVLLLVDWFKGRRITVQVLAEKVPYLIYVTAFGGITVILLRGILSSPLNLAQGLLLFLWCLTFYLRQFFFPATLSPIYEFPTPISIHQPGYASALMIFIIMMMALGYFWKNRLFRFAFGYYFISIFFLLRFNDVFSHIGLVNDRFMYLPSLGFCLWAGDVINRGMNNLRKKHFFSQWLGIVGIVLLFVVMFFKTTTQCRIWENGGSLWRYVLTIYPQNSRVNNNLADYLLTRGQSNQEIIGYCKQALLSDPKLPAAHVNMGTVLAREGHLDQAIQYFQTAVMLDPQNSVARVNLGTALYSQGKFAQAIRHLEEGIRLGFVNANSLTLLGRAKMKTKEWDSAEHCFQQVLILDPNDVDAERILKELNIMRKR